MGVRRWKAFEGEGCCEAAQRGSDLAEGSDCCRHGIATTSSSALTMTMFKLEAAAWGKPSLGAGWAPSVTAMASERRAAWAASSEGVERRRSCRSETKAPLPLPACVGEGGRGVVSIHVPSSRRARSRGTGWPGP